MTAINKKQFNFRNIQLDLIFELSPNGYIWFGKFDIITLVNPEALRLLNCEDDDIIFTTKDEFVRLINARQRGSWTQKLSIDDLTEDNEFIVELSIPKHRILSCKARKMRNYNDYNTESIGTCLYLKDITKETQFNHVNNEYIATVAHELKQPLVSMLGFSELLLEGDLKSEESQKMLKIIYEQADKLKAHVDQILDLDRIQHGDIYDLKRELISCEAIIKEIIGANQRHIKQKIQIQQPENWPMVYIDPFRLFQAINNLLVNAAKYSNPSSTIDIRLDTQQAPNGKNHFTIAIQDQGIGMSSAQLKHVGKRYYRTEQSQAIQGNGLGVNLAKEILKMHGGRLEFSSEIGIGTTAKIWIPVAEESLAYEEDKNDSAVQP